jgi:nucleoside triphosphate pyrophosphatase
VIARALALGPLVLASRSPQRRALLTQLGIDFTVVEPSYEEHDPEGADPPALAAGHARGKTQAVDGDAVLGVDTVVAVDGRVLAKPADRDQAEAFLQALSGRTHEVHSGLCLAIGGRLHEALETTLVTFVRLEPGDVRWYVNSGEWRERAGGYAIQGRGAALVERIEGDYTNVVGLPVPALLRTMGNAVR